jgi:hypothetical protein
MNNVKDNALQMFNEWVETPVTKDSLRITNDFRSHMCKEAFLAGFEVCKLALEQKEQEPSAYGDLFSGMRINRFLTLSSEVAKAFSKDNYKLTPLYTSPQLKTYVPLTDDEIKKLLKLSSDNKNINLLWNKTARTIEQAVLSKLSLAPNYAIQSKK